MFFFHTSWVYLIIVMGFSWLLGMLLGVPVISWLKKKDHYNQLYKAHCEKLEALHHKKESTPTAGGILFLIVMLASTVLWLSLRSPLTWLFVFLILSWGGLGWYDDVVKKRRKKGHGVTAKQKLCVQVCIATITVATLMILYRDTQLFSSLRIPFFGSILLGNGLVGKGMCFLLSVLAIVGTSNAVNLTDGLDGLAAGSVGVASMGCLIIAMWISATPLTHSVAVMSAVLVGVCFAFLHYNYPPAKVFMGDTGSLLLGGILGSCAVMLRAELLLILLGGIFVIEAGSVIVQVASCRWLGRRVFLCSPLHHHYEYKGKTEKAIVRAFWLTECICVIIGVLSVI